MVSYFEKNAAVSLSYTIECTKAISLKIMMCISSQNCFYRAATLKGLYQRECIWVCRLLLQRTAMNLQQQLFHSRILLPVWHPRCRVITSHPSCLYNTHHEMMRCTHRPIPGTWYISSYGKNVWKPPRPLNFYPFLDWDALDFQILKNRGKLWLY